MNFRKLVLVTGMIPAVLGASVFAACGGDDDDDGGSGGTGTDEKYVASICKAGAEFATAMEKLSKDLASEKDLEKAAEKAAEPFEDFAKAFAKANPPKDLKEWHDDASDALDKAVKGLKDGNFDALGDELMPDPPKDISDRLTKVADKNKDCQDADFNFGG